MSNLVLSFLVNLFLRPYIVQHCSSMMPRMWCTNSQVLPWSELTVRSLSFTVNAPQVRCSNSNGVSSDVWAVLGVEPGAPCNRVKYLNSETLLLCAMMSPILMTFNCFSCFLQEVMSQGEYDTTQMVQEKWAKELLYHLIKNRKEMKCLKSINLI